jgi:hypothetical protein
MQTMEDTSIWCNISDIRQLRIGMKVRSCLDMSGFMRSNDEYKWFTGSILNIRPDGQLTSVTIKRDDQSNGKWQSDISNSRLFGIQILNKDWDD